MDWETAESFSKGLVQEMSDDRHRTKETFQRYKLESHADGTFSKGLRQRCV